jgi:Nuclease-related domain
VSIRSADTRAGQFAHDRFIKRRRAWRRRSWWAFPTVFLVPLAIALPIGLLTRPPHRGFLFGVALGLGAGAALLLFDSPPFHVEKWRIGSDGEKATARHLRPLLRNGWTLFNDIETEYGNIDHVLVGPAGVFMLESKRLAGQVSVASGKLILRRYEDPEDGYDNESIAGRARGAALELHSQLDSIGTRLWVQAVVVLWAEFEQRSIERDHVAWVRGNELRSVLEARPVRYSDQSLEQLTAATRAAVQRLRDAAGARGDD